MFRVTLVALLTGVVASCSPSSTPNVPGASTECARDRDCSIGEECGGAGCVPARPTLYGHIQLATVLFRPYNDNSEIDWRATHSDLIIGQTRPDEMRAVNPNVRLFGYFTNTYHLYETEGAAWAVAHGHDPEDLYLHFREDVLVPGWGIIVPGYPAGVVPGWNPNWQPGDPPASASERSQARVVGAAAGSSLWYFANLDNPAYRQFLAARATSLMDGSLSGAQYASGPLEGSLVDNAIYYPIFDQANLSKTNEFYGIPLDDTHPYAVAFELFYTEAQQVLAGAFGSGTNLMPNYGHSLYLSRPDRFSQSIQEIVDWVYAEVWLTHRAGDSPTSGGSRVISYDRDYGKQIANIVRQSRAGGRRVLGARDYSVAGITGTDRGHLYTLALYYLVHNPNTFYLFETAQTHKDPAHVSQWMWNPAVTYDVGTPAPVPAGLSDFNGETGTSEHYILESGPDPFDPSLTYHILARNFTKALVLVKMLPVGSVTDDRSATTHVLDKPYALLQGDGTKGPIVTEVTLRNNEGSILVDP